MAQACYERVVGKRGQQPRVLTKMALLARNQGLRNQEITVLRQLATVERRKPELANIYLRLAQLHQGMDPDEVVKHAIQSLAYAHDNLEAVNLVCETLIQGGRPTEAIQVLTETLVRLENDKDNQRKAELEIAIGEIWETYLGRKDLARERYVRALGLADSEPVLKRLSDIFRQIEDRPNLAKSLQEIVNVGLKNKTFHGGEIIEQLTHLYLDDLNEPTKALTLYRALHSAGALRVSDLTRLLSWPNFKGEWKKFYDELVARPLAGEQRDRIDWETLLGDFARQKLEDDARASTHYLSALKLGGLDRSNFGFLTRHLRTSKRHADLVEALRLRLQQVDVDERWEIVRELVRYPSLLGDDEADNLAFQLLTAPEATDEFFHKRLDHYQGTNKVEALVRFASKVGELGDRAQIAKRLDDVLEHIEGAKHAKKYEAAALVLEAIKRERGESPAFLEKALGVLWHAGDKALARPYLMRLVELKRLPSFPKEAVLERLRETPSHQALYYGILLAGSDHEQTTASSLAREAWSVMRNVPGMDEEKIDALATMARHGLLTREEMTNFKEIAARLGRWLDLREAFNKQLRFAKDKRDSSFLLHNLIEIEWFHEHNLEGALALYQRLVTVAEDTLKAWMELAEFAVRNAPEDKAAPFVADVWQQPDLHRRPDFVQKALEWLGKIKITKAQAAELTLPVTERMLVTGGGEIAVDIASHLLSKGIATPRTASATLQRALQGDSEEEFARVFHHGLGVFRDPLILQEYLNTSLRIFTTASQRPFFEQLLVQGLSAGFPVALFDRAESDVRYFLARVFFDEARQKGTALKLFRELFTDNPEDVRNWEPYYQLLKDADERDEALKFLAQVIPQIKSGDIQPGAMGLTLTALEADWRRFLKPEGAEDSMMNVAAVAMPELGKVLPSIPQHEQSPNNVLSFPTRKPEAVDDDEPDAQEFRRAANDDLDEKTRTHGRTHIELAPTPTPEKAPLPAAAPPGRDESSSRGYLNDWRSVVRKFEPRASLAQAILDKAFPGEVEKHVALQAVALLSGEMEPLTHWQYKVWRDFQELPYRLDMKTRLANEEADPALASDLARLIAVLTPGLLYFYRDRFSLAAVAKRMKVPLEKLQQARRIIPWDDEFFTRSGLQHYAAEINAGRMRAAALPGLGMEIFYDASDRVFYLDPRHYQKHPPSHLRHRLLWALRALRLNYYFLLTLDPISEVVPFLSAARESLERRGFDALKVSVGIQRDPVGPSTLR